MYGHNIMAGGFRHLLNYAQGILVIADGKMGNVDSETDVILPTVMMN